MAKLSTKRQVASGLATQGTNKAASQNVGQEEETAIATDLVYMLQALELARTAGQLGEVPVGAVVVLDGHVIAAAYNRREVDASPSAHAEFLALTQAAEVLGRWRLSDCTVYVTLEPCLMCAGLMHQARIKRCVYGTADPKAGALGSLYAVHEDSRLNHNFTVTSGMCAQESAQLLSNFFAQLRS